MHTISAGRAQPFGSARRRTDVIRPETNTRPGAADSEPPWARMHLECQAAFLRHLGTSPLARISPDPAVHWVVTGVWSNTHNGVVSTHLPQEQAADRIRAVVERFRAAGVPGTWFVTENDQPADLGTLLTAAGCTPEQSGVVMGASRTRLRQAEGPTPPPGVRVVEVLDDHLLKQWFAAAASVWQEELTGEAALGRRVQRRLYTSLGFGPGHPWRHWVALRGCTPVGMVSAFYRGDRIDLENVGVVEPERRRGLGRTLTLTPVYAAPARARWVVLGPTPEGAPLYRSMGFTTARCLPDREFFLPAHLPTPWSVALR